MTRIRKWSATYSDQTSALICISLHASQRWKILQESWIRKLQAARELSFLCTFLNAFVSHVVVIEWYAICMQMSCIFCSKIEILSGFKCRPCPSILFQWHLRGYGSFLFRDLGLLFSILLLSVVGQNHQCFTMFNGKPQKLSFTYPHVWYFWYCWC